MQQTSVLILLARIGKSGTTVVNERIFPDSHIVFQVPVVRALFSALRSWLYHGAAAIVVQSERSKQCFSRTLQEKVFTIPNVVERSAFAQPVERENFIMSVGRLVRQKRHDITIRAFAKIAHLYPEWNLRIFGEGPLRSMLHELASDLGVADRVQLLGFQENIAEAYQRCGIFVLSSDFEGFPNALAEALSAGAPCISSNCPTGPAELIVNGVGGLLFETGDSEELAAQLSLLLSNPMRRKELSESSDNGLIAYRPSTVIKQWEELLNQIS
jgi:glycosyltransferase involved in cell wall biosynthesis